ncbi:MAG: Deoxyguanosine kinase [Candidatus Woesebacteria bacterium GW2011_GWA1_45_8]|uniref:Deoxyguanosine kinase n=1 Tax=Candidatus Woesebacteria bacterium GW2011_GWA1_45_8 TaxID=1618559 RepID=A0A0G1Q339_9BACT|nr:MAG: Deoxyguanosine kinase [Candidatus Woesebacteria bacterium GW2011_GWA1_45_8]
MKEREPKRRYPYIAVVGAAGTGKSKLTELMVESFGVESFKEDFQPNPHLPKFYFEDPFKHAFNSQMFFLTEEAKQMPTLWSLLRYRPVVHDQAIEGDDFFETALRLLGFISELDHKTYKLCFRTLMRGNYLPRPDIYIGVIASQESVVRRIVERKRDMELAMHEKFPLYFPTIAHKFGKWLELLTRQHPVILIDTDKWDFVNDPHSRNFVLQEIRNRASRLLTDPNQVNLLGREGARLILPDFLKSEQPFSNPVSEKQVTL